MPHHRWPLAAALLACCSSDDGKTWELPDPEGYVSHKGSIAGCTGDIAFKTFEYTGGAPTATLVFANGRTDYTARYEHIVPLLDRPWNVVMFDHYGQGFSNGPRAHADDFDAQHVCDMKAVIDQLAAPDLPVVVAAHSMGAFISTRLAQLHPELVRAYVLSAPMYGLPGFAPETAKMLAQIQIELGNATAPYNNNTDDKDTCEENLTTHDCEYYDRWLDDPTVWIGNPTWGWVLAAYTGFDRITAQTAAITKPMLIFQAEADAWVDNSSQDVFCAAVPTCQRVVKPGSYHEVFNELDRADSLAEAAAFLDPYVE